MNTLYNISMLVRASALWTVLAIFFFVLMFAVSAYAWVAPTASPPSGNISAPINVGASAQTKSGNIGVNGLAVFGNSLFSGLTAGTGRYLNFDYTVGGTSGTGLSGYGIRDNAGTIEFKNLGGTGGTSGWKNLGTIINEYITLGSQWVAGTGGAIYYNGGYVGIGNAVPARTLDVIEVANSAAYKEVARFAVANNAGATNFSRLLFGQTAANSMFIEAADQANTKGVLQLQPYGAGKVTIGNTAATHKLSVLGNAVSGSHAIYGVTGISDSATHGVLGAAGSYWAGLGRGDGYSFVGNGVLYNNGAVQATSFLYLSDARLKKNVKALDAGLVTLMKLRPVSFTWKDAATGMEGMEDSRAGTNDIGLIAQEVEEILPGVVSTDTKGIKSVDYVRLVPILIQAVQDQQSEIQALKARLERLEATH